MSKRVLPKLNYRYGLGVGFDARELKSPFFEPTPGSQITLSGDSLVCGRADLGADPRLRGKLNRLARIFRHESRLAEWMRDKQAGGLACVVPPGLRQPQSVRFYINTAGQERRRMAVVVGAGSELNLTVVQNGDADVTTLLEIWVGAGATLRTFRVQDFRSGSVVSRIQAAVGANASYTHAECLFGGDYTASTVQAKLIGQEASHTVQTLVLGSEREKFDLLRQATVNAPGGSVCLQTANVLMHHSQLVDRGLITIPAGKAGSKARQQAETLLLSPHATYASQPELEVAESEVECGHASSVGSLDQEQLFYLMSRGLDEATANRQLVQGFLEPILRKMRQAGLHEMVNCLVAKRFGLELLDC